MPIHDQSYRRYTGERHAHGYAWRVIARTAIRAVLRRRMFLAVLLLAWVPFLVRAVQIYVASNVPQAAMLAVTPATFREFLAQQSVFVFFVTIYVGAGLIADDRRANALQLYLSRPMTRWEYIAGKVVVVVVFVMGVTWVPAVLLLILQVAFDGPGFVRGHPDVIPAITLLAVIEGLVAALSVLALSSLSKSRRFVSMMYAAVVFFATAVTGVIQGMTQSRALSWLSPQVSLGIVGDAIFRVPSRYGDSVALGFLTLVLVAVVSLVILERRVRGVEVVT